MKYNLINSKTQEVVYQSDKKLSFGGPWGECDRNGNPIYVWVDAPALTLDECKYKKYAEIKQARDKAEEEPLPFKETLFDFDQRSRERLLFAIAAGEPSPWTDYYNKVIDLTASDIEELSKIIKARTQEIHVRYNLLKRQIETAKTYEELEIIKF